MRLVALLLLLLALLPAAPAAAQDLEALVAELPEGDFSRAPGACCACSATAISSR
jgi:hypothetical protein